EVGRAHAGVSIIGCRFLFFQAEDGIRVRNVTGVQTCALPISADDPRPRSNGIVERKINSTRSPRTSSCSADSRSAVSTGSMWAGAASKGPVYKSEVIYPCRARRIAAVACQSKSGRTKAEAPDRTERPPT